MSKQQSQWRPNDIAGIVNEAGKVIGMMPHPENMIEPLHGSHRKGEIEYRKLNFDEAFAHLRKSVELYNSIRYDEPWGFMQPTRHALGALLLEQNRIEEAEASLPR